MRFFRRKRRDPFYATVELKPGTTRLDLTHDGVPIGCLVLASFSTSSRDGASAEFVSLGHFLAARSI
jgi:hypothetical protein